MVVLFDGGFLGEDVEILHGELLVGDCLVEGGLMENVASSLTILMETGGVDLGEWVALLLLVDFVMWVELVDLVVWEELSFRDDTVV